MIAPEIKDLLTELVNIGIGRASVRFSELLNREIIVAMPRLLFIPASQFADHFTQGVNSYVNLQTAFTGGVTGVGVVSFPLPETQTLLNILLERELSEERTYEVLELDALTEVGNILLSAIFSAFAEYMGAEVESNIPRVLFEENIFSPLAQPEDDLLCVGECVFAVKGVTINGKVLLVLHYSDILALARNMEQL